MTRAASVLRWDPFQIGPKTGRLITAPTGGGAAGFRFVGPADRAPPEGFTRAVFQELGTGWLKADHTDVAREPTLDWVGHLVQPDMAITRVQMMGTTPGGLVVYYIEAARLAPHTMPDIPRSVRNGALAVLDAASRVEQRGVTGRAREQAPADLVGSVVTRWFGDDSTVIVLDEKMVRDVDQSAVPSTTILVYAEDSTQRGDVVAQTQRQLTDRGIRSEVVPIKNLLDGDERLLSLKLRTVFGGAEPGKPRKALATAIFGDPSHAAALAARDLLDNVGKGLEGLLPPLGSW